MSKPEPKFELELKISVASYNEMESYYHRLLTEAGQVIGWHLHGKRCYIPHGREIPESDAVMKNIDEALGWGPAKKEE